MEVSPIFRLLCLALLLAIASCCSVLHLKGLRFQMRQFRALPISHTRDAGLTSGRPAYVSIDNDKDKKKLYLYHVVSGSHGVDQRDGLGRWVVNDVLGKSDTALSYLNTWAVTPTLHAALADNNPNLKWKIHDGNGWVADDKMSIVCRDGVDTSAVYFAAEGAPWRVSGFFVEHDTHQGGFPVYSHVGAEGDQQLYLFKYENKWIIGHDIGTANGLAYTTAPQATNAAELVKVEWLFATNNIPTWQRVDAHILVGDDAHDVYAKLRQHRNLTSRGDTYVLRNGMSMPTVGLGTGGIDRQRTSEVLIEALRLGYRLLDSAREYGNEKAIGDIVAVDGNRLTGVPTRREVFIISKVWPTFLGYLPTSKEISKSLEALQTPYIDQYLLHWPTCDKRIPWMHCETTVDPNGTWKQSWNALERAYAEGRVASIGVSNFHEGLLGEFWGFGSVRPHLVQNSGEPGKLDDGVRRWCTKNEAVYMPYAHQRNLNFLSQTMKEVIQSVAVKNGVSPHVVTSRFFYQTGAAIVPRSSQYAHLKENLEDVFKFELTEEEMRKLGWTPTLLAESPQYEEL